MSPQADAVIKTTARYQQTNEPPRQKPIIKIDPRHQQELMAHINEANQLASNIRASIDSGRDNPFRPDGEIYKLTNPIVDYYKFGPNQSRAVTPTYAELDYFSSKNKRKRRANEKAKGKNNGSDGRESCWRRWFCCCCRCFCSRSSASKSTSVKPQSGNEISQSSEWPPVEDPDKTTTRQHLDKDTTSKTMEPNDGMTAKGTDLRQASSLSLSGGGGGSGKQLKTKNDNANKTRTTTQQIKKVVLEDDHGPTMDSSSSIQNNGNAALKEDDTKDKSLHSPNTNQSSSLQEPKTTKVKTVRTSRCVVI